MTQPLIVDFSTFTFFSQKSGDRKWCCLSHLVSYFQIDAVELFMIYLPRLNSVAEESTLEITVDSGNTIEKRSRDWIIKNIGYYALNMVFVPHTWVQEVFRDYMRSLAHEVNIVLSHLKTEGFFGLRSTQNTLLDPYYQLLAEFIKRSEEMSAQLVAANDHEGHPVEYAWIFWNQLMYCNPIVVISPTPVELPLVQIQGKGQIRYCLEQVL